MNLGFSFDLGQRDPEGNRAKESTRRTILDGLLFEVKYTGICYVMLLPRSKISFFSFLYDGIVNNI